MLTVLDEYTREALNVTVATRMGSAEVPEALYPLLLGRGKPECLRSQNVLSRDHSPSKGQQLSLRQLMSAISVVNRHISGTAQGGKTVSL